MAGVIVARTSAEMQQIATRIYSKSPSSALFQLFLPSSTRSSITALETRMGAWTETAKSNSICTSASFSAGFFSLLSILTMAAVHGKVQRGIMQEIGLLEGENNKDYLLHVSGLIRGRRIRISHFQEGDPDGSYSFSPFPSIRIRISVKNERNSSILAGPKQRQAPTRRTETFSNCTRLPSFRKTVPHFFTRLDITRFVQASICTLLPFGP